jgi:ribosomal protein L40E
MVQQMEAAREPSVFVDFEFPEQSGRLVIGNNGDSPALNVRFIVNEDIAWRSSGGDHGITAIDAIRDGVPFLAPHRILKFFAGYVDWQAMDKKRGILDVRIIFENELQRKFTRDYRVDIGTYAQASSDSYHDPSLAVAEAIREAENSRRSQETMQSITHRLFTPHPKTKICSFCGKQIPEAAKKCPECHEFIGLSRERDDEV